MKRKTNHGLKIICLNRKASFNYFFEDILEAGIVLKGSEIKSIRNGKVNIADSYAIEKKGEIVLINSHISSYKQASYSNHNPMDERKLLLSKREINKLIGKMQREGFTIVPTKMYFKKGIAKIEIAIAKGKKQFDKRAVKKNRDWNRDKARYIRNNGNVGYLLKNFPTLIMGLNIFKVIYLRNRIYNPYSLFIGVYSSLVFLFKHRSSFLLDIFQFLKFR